METSAWVLAFFNSSPGIEEIDKSMKVVLFRLVSAVDGETPTGVSITATSSEEVGLFLDSILLLDLIETIDFYDDPLI